MSNDIEVYETEWDESTPCPKCGCRVLKVMYATVYNGEGYFREYDHEATIIQCPNCDYDITKHEGETDND